MSCSHAFLPGIALLILIHANAVGQEADVPESVVTEDSIEIPIEKVWSNRIERTRDIYELEVNVPDELMGIAREYRDLINSKERSTLTQQIARKLLPRRLSLTDKPKMFAVLGQGEEALRAAHKVIVEGAEPQRSFSSGDNITLIFFAHSYATPIHIQRITREANKVRVEYQVAASENFPMRSMDRVHLALIPIASVQPKELHVEVNRLESENTEVERSIQNPVLPIDSIEYVVSGPCQIDIR